MSQISILPLSLQHIRAISAVHLAAFPNRALSCLGKKAVAGYYETLINNPNFNLSIGAFEEQKLLGYLIGGEVKGVMRSYLRKYAAYLFLHVVTHPWVLTRPCGC
jgi:hypothetical protein